ncbi:PXMP2/4 family protein 4 [Hyalella azteca]|uniref:PXMP2/4 family protein 4 n=1 Tax=Hyalella azteca TaxID=294128 RepID=A0A8B7NKR4_HYAAZ|nr:PXMP2/4 family protein 4 [Hyalella azteca]
MGQWGRRAMAGMQQMWHAYPVTRGMTTYALLWPTSNMVQQGLDPGRQRYDPLQGLRFLVMGTFITAPTVYVWVKIASKLVRGNSLRHAMLKALYDITLFAPVGQSQFYFGISALEGKSLAQCTDEVKEKLIPSWKVAACFWPIVQTFNFAYVAERNRVVVVSVGSFIWTIFLSYMHHTDVQNRPSFLRPKRTNLEPQP